jgi:signal transduction histidine kinase
MIKIYVFYFFILVNYAFAQQTPLSNLDSISIKLKGKSAKQKCLYFLKKAEQVANSNTKYSYLYSQEALKEALLSNIDSLIGLSYSTLGNNYQLQTQLDSSLFYHKNALLYREKLNDTLGMADSYNNIGIAYDSKGAFENALRQYFMALKLYEKKQENEKTAMTLVNIGVVYKTQKEYKKAYNYYKRAYELYKSLKSEFGMTATSGNFGAILINFKAYKKSLLYSKQAKDGYEKLGFRRHIAYPLSNIAVVYDSLHRFEDANKNYIASIALYEEFSNNFEVANICNAFSNCLIKQKKFKESIVYAEKALQYAKVAEANFVEICALKNLAKAYGGLGVYEKAYYYANLYNAGSDRLFKFEKTKAIFEVEAKYESEKKSKLLMQVQNTIQQRNTWVLILCMLIISVGLISYLIYRQQKIKALQQAQAVELKTAVAAVESKNNLQEQRMSISRDLHDNIGAQLTFIISSINNIKHAFVIDNAKLEGKLQSISAFAKSTIVELRDTIWAMNVEHISLEDVRFRIFNFIEKAKLTFETTEFNFEIDPQLSRIYFSSMDGLNVYRIIQEAVHNSIKYAQALEINVQIRRENKFVIIEIKDNGVGFNPNKQVWGNGLENMKKRIKDIGGNYELLTKINEGTTITIQLPYKKYRIG